MLRPSQSIITEFYYTQARLFARSYNLPFRGLQRRIGIRSLYMRDTLWWSSHGPQLTTRIRYVSVFHLLVVSPLKNLEQWYHFIRFVQVLAGFYLSINFVLCSFIGCFTLSSDARTRARKWINAPCLADRNPENRFIAGSFSSLLQKYMLLVCLTSLQKFSGTLVDAYNSALSEVEKDLYGKSAADTLVRTAQQVCVPSSDSPPLNSSSY